jgi:two-component system cell cycle sensor histidine kinase PleC
LRGEERRITNQGRRAADRDKGAPSWLRIAILGSALAMAVYVLFFARELARPGQEADALRAGGVAREARLLAFEIDARLGRSIAGVRAGQAALADGAAPETALERALQAAPNGAFAVVEDDRVVAAVGGQASKFTTDPARPRLTADGQALLSRSSAEARSVVVGRTPLPPLTASGRTDLWLLSGPSSVLAGTRRDVAGLGLSAQPVRAGEDETVKWAKGSVRRAAVAVGDTDLIAVASTPVAVGASALLDDAWVLGAPVGIGAFVMLLILLMQRRQVGISRAGAASEKRFRGAVEAASCGVWEWDIEAELVTVSDFMAEMLGLDRSGAVPAEAVMERIHPRYRETVVHALRQAEAFGTFEVSFPVPDSEGRARWIDARGQARKDRETGAAILGVALDTTEARRAKAQAQAAESRLRDGIESVSDAFVLFDRNDRLILSNQAFEDAFGFGPGVVRRGAVKADLNQIAGLAIKSDQPAPGGRAGAREVELHDGRWLQLVERFTSDGGSVVTAADITAIKHKEAERQRATERLQTTVAELEDRETQLSLLARKYEVAMTRAEAANQAKSEFLANMSHELRTPLNAINGFSEIMAGEMFGPLGDAKYKGYAADILKSGQHLLSLINDILDMAKIEAGKHTLHYEPVSLKELAEDAARLMRGKVEEAGLKLLVDAPALPVIEADHRGLKQVMLNLISNAVKFTPEGGEVVVRLSAIDDARLRVAVTDTGIGIAAEDVHRLARPFEQVEGQHSKTTQGTGLGLALTKSLIELHGGTLTIDSEPGRGTTVSFDIPIRRPDAAVQDQARAA